MNTQSAHPVRKHRREVWTRIYVPIFLPLVGIVILCAALVIAVATDALVSTQVTVIMSVVATACLALPMAVLCAVPVFLLITVAYGTGQLYAHARTPLRFMRRQTERIAAATNQHVPKLARPVIALNTRVARWETSILSWQQSALPPGKEPNDE